MGDVASDVSAAQAPAAGSPYLPMRAEVTSVRKLTGMEMLFGIRLSDGRALGHDPGQFVQVSVPGVGECPISICSSPTRPETFELCIRRVGAVTEALHRLEAGAEVGIRGPLGQGFDVRELTGKDILIVAGGLGIAPVRSLVQYILDERERFGQFHLLYGARNPSELLFRDDLTRWRENDGVNLLVTVDEPDEQWRGKSGVVTRLFTELPRLDPGHTQVVIVGPPVMFKFAVLEVLARRIPQSSVYCSLERRMKCGVGKCGHCQANNIYVCLEGPVFNYSQLKALREAVQ
jgi:sulfhydrogenase subunit gamma (sulfur reductase)